MNDLLSDAAFEHAIGWRINLAAIAAAERAARLSETAARQKAEAEVTKLQAVVAAADDAIAEYIRYLDGGEMRGSYDGKPERNGLRKASYRTRHARSVGGF